MDAYERIEKATAVCGEAVSNVKPDQFDNATPCAEFNVKDLLRHIIGGLGMLDEAANGGSPGMPDVDIVSDDPGGQYAEARAKLLETLKQPGVFDKTWAMPFGQMPGKMMAGIAFMEHVTHAWDVKKATGQSTDLPEDLVNEVLGVVTPMDQMLRMPGVCGPAVEVPDSASPTEKLVAFMGRTP
jgi:uncharacterized protein (TIGR03086 family)